MTEHNSNPSSIYRLNTSLRNLISSFEEYFINSVGNNLVSSLQPITKQAYGGSHLVTPSIFSV